MGTSRLGFRIDGVAGYDAATKEAVRVGFLKCRTMEDSIMALRRIVEDVSSEGLDETCWTSPGELAGRFVQRLNVLRSAFEASEFLRTSECIGSSVMHVVDHTGRVDVFGSTSPRCDLRRNVPSTAATCGPWGTTRTACCWASTI